MAASQYSALTRLLFHFRSSLTTTNYTSSGAILPPSKLVTQGAISLKVLVSKLAPKLVYFVLRKELLNFSETVPRLKCKIWTGGKFQIITEMNNPLKEHSRYHAWLYMWFLKSSCARGMIHNRIHLIRTGCLRPSRYS